MNEKIIKVLYFEGELKLLDDFESWEIQSESFSKLLEFIGNLQQLKTVKISNKLMEGQRIAPIIAALYFQV